MEPQGLEIPILFSWQPEGPPEVHRVDLELSASVWPTGWTRALQRDVVREVRTLSVSVSEPKVISVPIKSLPLRCRSFLFPSFPEISLPGRPVGPTEDIGQGAVEVGPGTQGEMPSGHSVRQKPPSWDGAKGSLEVAGPPVRIRPPEELVKLEDRLRYLLEPPLDRLLADRRLVLAMPPLRYQLEGVAFLYPRHAAILADEMGLGKTMQAILAIRLLLRSGEIRRVLVVCPKPLVTNWVREFSLWAPEIPVLVIEGEPERRAWQWRLPAVPVKIANYELLIRDEVFWSQAESAEATPRIRFDLVVLDEAQRIKNRSGAIHRAVCSLPRHRSWALTGTPVENSAEDLVGIFEFLAPGYLHPEMKPRRMGQAIRDYVLRRTQEQVLPQLPPKWVRDAEVELTPEQRHSYQQAEEQGVLYLRQLGQQVTIRHVFELILRLKQICNFDPVTGASAKLERLEADLEEVAASRRKAIVFSQWVSTLEQLARLLARFGPVQYHGRISLAGREAAIRRFREDPGCRVLLISYGAGGVGLNLQVANYVFLFDRWWNPAVEDQAICRAHRLGTDGPVWVTRFLARDTIEQRIQEILDQKRALFETVLSAAQQGHRWGLTHEELFGLFRLQVQSSAQRIPSAA
ncbi:MAG: DEAD/DEAH box helicase [Thermoguttaceae bacterium]|nr:DEAD/DEAH box helicase [Thermoguttaceae bacterium]MDW8039174.1 DEAD/DEAH box helicase [Thermoguttaceae bacterium]